MKQVMKPVLIAAFSAILLTTTRAQTSSMPAPEDRANKLTEWMKTNLELTSDQVPPVQSINLKYANKLQEVQQSSQTKQQKMRSLKADGDAKDQELKRVLTSEQFQTWLTKKEDLKKQVKEKVKAKKKGG